MFANFQLQRPSQVSYLNRIRTNNIFLAKNRVLHQKLFCTFLKILQNFQRSVCNFILIKGSNEYDNICVKIGLTATQLLTYYKKSLEVQGSKIKTQKCIFKLQDILQTEYNFHSKRCFQYKKISLRESMSQFLVGTVYLYYLHNFILKGKSKVWIG